MKLDVNVLSAKLSNETMSNSHEYINYIELINSDDGTSSSIPSLRHHVGAGLLKCSCPSTRHGHIRAEMPADGSQPGGAGW